MSFSHGKHGISRKRFKKETRNIFEEFFHFLCSGSVFFRVFRGKKIQLFTV